MTRHNYLLRYVLFFITAVLLMTGCAQTWSAKVLQFEHWPDDASGAGYYLRLEPEQQNNLEYQAVADAVRAAIGSVGLVEQDSEQARFTLTVDFGHSIERKWVERYQGPLFSPFGGYWSGFGPYWGGGLYYGPEWVVVPAEVYQSTLSVRITDNSHDGKEVYRATATTERYEDNVLNQLRLLAEAVFADFPGISGHSRIIEKRLD